MNQGVCAACMLNVHSLTLGGKATSLLSSFLCCPCCMQLHGVRGAAVATFLRRAPSAALLDGSDLAVGGGGGFFAQCHAIGVCHVCKVA